MGALLTMAEYLLRIRPRIFRKKHKPGGRQADGLFTAIGNVMTDARDRILVAADQMHPATAGGSMADRWGRLLGGLYRLPAEDGDDAAYNARLGDAAAFWRGAGATGFFTDWLARIGWTVVVTVAPDHWCKRILTISAATGETDSLQLVHDVAGFQAAHLLYEIDLGGALDYAGADYHYAQTTGWDDIVVRPAIDFFKAWS